MIKRICGVAVDSAVVRRFRVPSPFGGSVKAHCSTSDEDDMNVILQIAKQKDGGDGVWGSKVNYIQVARQPRLPFPSALRDYFIASSLCLLPSSLLYHRSSEDASHLACNGLAGAEHGVFPHC